jgi:hypothetical protein
MLAQPASSTEGGRRALKPSSKIEQFLEHVLAPLPRVPTAGLSVDIVVVVGPARLRSSALFPRSYKRGAALEDLVEFPAIEPYAPALRTEVDLYALSVRYVQLGAIYWTSHGREPTEPIDGASPQSAVGVLAARRG